MNNVISYIESRSEKYLDELKDFLRWESISSSAAHREATYRCARWVEEHLKSIGLDTVKFIETAGHPIVYAEWMGAPDSPTVLIYGHYDVQPVDPVEKWSSGPFEPDVRNGKIYARGTTDDKGQLFTHIKAIEAFFNVHGKLPVNIKFVIEGEEEIGSSNLEKFVKENKDLLKADILLISDTAMFAPGVPTICYGLRGLSYFQIDVSGPNRDLHSGTYGGVVHNPAEALADMLNAMRDKEGRVKIPGFYDDVRKLSKEERTAFKKLPFNQKKYAGALGVRELYGEKRYTPLERLWARPTFEVNGMWGGYSGEGAKTVIPSVAGAKVSMRLVPDQNPKKIARLFRQYVKKISPKTVKVELTEMHGAKPAIAPIQSLGVKAAVAALEKGFGKQPLYQREGGSIPIVVNFQEELKVTPVLLGFGLPDENAHSPDEHLDLNNFYGGIRTSAYYFDILASMNKNR